MGWGWVRLWLGASTVVTGFWLLVLTHYSRPDAIVVILEMTLVPSALVLVAGAVLVWAFRGLADRLRSRPQ
jgi:hypothetical protein